MLPQIHDHRRVLLLGAVVMRKGASTISLWWHPGNKPFEFKIGVGKVIKGWDEAIMKMSEVSGCCRAFAVPLWVGCWVCCRVGLLCIKALRVGCWVGYW